MARVATNDPMEKFRFLVDFSLPDSSAPVRLGFHDVQMPKRTTNKIMYREGGDPDISGVSAGLNTMEDIVLNRGLIAGDGAQANDFLKWAKTVHPSTPGITTHNSATTALHGSNSYRSEVTIKMLDREGKVSRAWKIHQAFPVSFIPGSDLNAAEDGEKSLESLTLTYEDFQELAVAEPDAALGAAL